MALHSAGLLPCTLVDGQLRVFIVHLGGPDHPVHIHMTEFQMNSRRQWPVVRQMLGL